MNAKMPSEKEIQLLSLVVTERAGREIARLYEREAGVGINYGTLYVTLQRLRNRGWVNVRDSKDSDGRVRHYRITGLGAEALAEGRIHHAWIANFGTAGSLSGGS